MKTTTILTSVILAALAMHTTANAQGEDKKAKAGPGSIRAGGPPRELLEKFDKDGDGKLSEAERAELKQEMMQRKEAREAKMLKRFDTDKDGTLSREEKKAAFPTIREENMVIHQAALKEFDKDGDGNLSPAEREGTREWIAQNYPDAIFMPPGRGPRAGKGGLHRQKGPKGGGKTPGPEKKEEPAE